MGIKHAYVTGKPDDPAADVSSNEWNADHVIVGPLALNAAPVDPMDAATKQYVDDAISAIPPPSSGALMADIAPVNPAQGQLWWKSDEGNLYIRFGTTWVQINTVGS